MPIDSIGTLSRTLYALTSPAGRFGRAREPAISDETDTHSTIRTRGEEAIGELAQALLENSVFNSALGRALGAGERAVQAQRTAMGALNIASSAELERLGRRLRSLSDRMEAIEDRIDELSDDVAALRAASARERSAP